MNSTHFARAYFNTQFAAAKLVQYKPEWENGTGYFNNALKEPVTELVSFVDPHGRKGIIFSDVTGNIVIFERYSDGSGPIIIHFMKTTTYSSGKTYTAGTAEPLEFDYGLDDLIVRLTGVPIPSLT